MKLALALAAVTAACLAPIAYHAITRRFRKAQFTNHWLTAAEACGECALIEPPRVDLITDGWKCIQCQDKPALTSSVWCGKCGSRAEAAQRHPAGKQRKTGGAA